jgi:16S rRNA (cytidine1402-2'-O)-methyltransferase
MLTDRFCFQGFIPQKEQARRRFLAAALEHDIPQIFFETTRRLPKTLDLIEELAPDRPIAVARELTKLHEAFLRGNAKSILKEIQDTELPGEITMIVGAAPEKETGEQDIEAALRVALERGSLKDAVDDVSRLFKTPRRTIYNLALSVIKTRNDEL